MKKLILFFVIFVLFLYGCKENTPKSTTTGINQVLYDSITIHLDTTVRAGRFFAKGYRNDTQKYIFFFNLIDNTYYWYDINKNSLTKGKADFLRFDVVCNFYIKNLDSVYIFDDYKGRIFLCDSSFEIKDVINLKVDSSEQFGKEYGYTAAYYFKIKNNLAFIEHFSTDLMTKYNWKEYFLHTQEIVYDIKDSTIIHYGLRFPKKYTENFYNDIIPAKCFLNDSVLVYSFDAVDTLYFYNIISEKLTKKKVCKSSFHKDLPPIDFSADRYEEHCYFMENFAYSFIYCRDNEIFRICLLPEKCQNEDGMINDTRKWTILKAGTNSQVFNETIIPKRFGYHYSFPLDKNFVINNVNDDYEADSITFYFLDI